MTKPSTIAAALLLWSAGSALALDASVGVGDGGASASASVGDASVGASVGSDGSASAGASAGGASAGGSTGGGSSGGGASGGGSSDASGSSSGSSDGSSGSGGDASATGPAATTRAAGPAAARTGNPSAGEIVLPADLRPAGGGAVSRSQASSSPMQSIVGTSRQLIAACGQTVAQAAMPYGLVDYSVASYGRTRRLGDGTYRAPVFTRITYRREGGYEVREAPIWCHLDAAGTVNGLSDLS